MWEIQKQEPFIDIEVEEIDKQEVLNSKENQK
jgi:hypothetical protein